MSLGILFDLDGTLLDTLEDLRDAANYALSRFACPERSLEEVRSFVGNGAGLLIRRALPGGTDDPDWQAVLPVFREYYDAHCRIKTAPYVGIPEALSALRARYPLAIVSNKPDSAVKRLCGAYFGDIFARGEAEDCPRKPAPDMLFQAMKAIGADRAIYVGDSEVDVETARNAGMPCLSVLWGFRDRVCLERAGAKHFCREPRELVQMIDAMEEANGK